MIVSLSRRIRHVKKVGKFVSRSRLLIRRKSNYDDTRKVSIFSRRAGGSCAELTVRPGGAWVLEGCRSRRRKRAPNMWVRLVFGDGGRIRTRVYRVLVGYPSVVIILFIPSPSSLPPPPPPGTHAYVLYKRLLRSIPSHRLPHEPEQAFNINHVVADYVTSTWGLSPPTDSNLSNLSLRSEIRSNGISTYY